jgi:signal transduction histidine kinase
VSVPEYRVELVNEPMQGFFGERGIQGLKLEEILPPSVHSSYFPRLEEVIRTGRTYSSSEFRSEFLMTPEGAPRYFDFVLQPLRDEHGQIESVIHFAVEITASVRSRRSTEELFRQAQQALRARDEFLSVCSHELNSPITSLKFLTQTAARQIARNQFDLFTPERITRMIENQDRQITQIATLIGDMLDVSRVATGKLLLKPAPVDLSRLVTEICSRFTSELAAVGCELRTELAPGVVVRCDRFRVEQILTNLMTNAVKYAPGRPIELTVGSAGPVAEVIFQDHGPGIPLEDQKRIFERFERAASAEAPGGLGLGLYIARNLAQLHGGSLSVESEPGAGSAFVLSLPIAGPPEHE